MYSLGIRDVASETELLKEDLLGQERLPYYFSLGPSVILEESLYVLEYFRSYLH